MKGHKAMTITSQPTDELLGVESFMKS
jgi:hypothetical protein